MHVSVCVASHERPSLLVSALEGLYNQKTAAGEIVVVDSSRFAHCKGAVNEFARKSSHLEIRYVPSERWSLPYKRYLGGQICRGEIVLFIDDDVVLRPNAVDMILRAYRQGLSDGRSVIGVGLVPTDIDGNVRFRNPSTVREKWLGTSKWRSGSISNGGLTVAFPERADGPVLEVEWLWGGAMSFLRSELGRMGLLRNLDMLYQRGEGKAEDAVLSAVMGKHGRLVVLNDQLAVHLPNPEGVPRANAQSGWLRGIWGSWGRANTMRWIAKDPRDYKSTWIRVVSLELVRSAIGLARRPLSLGMWARFAGSIYGIMYSLYRWKSIPPTPG